MPDHIPRRAIERGEGYWCYYVIDQPEAAVAPAPATDNVSEAATFDEQLVYRPVTVEIVDGEPYAYYYSDDVTTEHLRRTGGKVYVSRGHVYAEPLPGAIPACKVDEPTPGRHTHHVAPPGDETDA